MISITMQDFNLRRQQENLTILDIRDQAAFDTNHLPEAISMPVTSLPNQLDQLDKQVTYYVLSYSGRRSEIITNFLVQNGFQAVHVIGGIKALMHPAA